MADRSAIEWCDSTFNPWTGCTKVSSGCDHCYAESWSGRAGAKVGKWGPGAPRVRTSAANWRLPVKWNAEPFIECGSCSWRGEKRAFFQTGPRGGRWTMCPSCASPDWIPARRRVFCASLADVFDNEVPAQWRLDLLDLIRTTPQLDWQLLTKRVGNVRNLLGDALGLAQDQMSRMQSEQGLANWLSAWVDGEPPANVWLGATIVNQEEADRDIPKLLATPARVRFLSIEPLLGPVDLTNVAPPVVEGRTWHGIDAITPANRELRGCVDWVIVGGESGHRARPMHLDWARSLRDQCAAAGVPFLFKQWGEWGPDWEGAATCQACGRTKFDAINSRGECGHCGIDAWMPADKPLDKPRRVGKKAAGRLLDGRTHDGFPAGVPERVPGEGGQQ